MLRTGMLVWMLIREGRRLRQNYGAQEQE